MRFGTGCQFMDPSVPAHREESDLERLGSTASSVFHKPPFSMSNTFRSANTP